MARLLPSLPCLRLLAACASGALLAACAAWPPTGAATAELQPTRGNTTHGTLRFEQRGDTLFVRGEVRGLRPGAEHGFHVHEKGDCSSGDGLSAGGHFNPTGVQHGRFGVAPHHVGDLPSLVADAAGVAQVNFESSGLRLGDGPTSLVGRGLIVHRDPDDFRTQPTGNAGPRLACAVIVRR